jgi:hypothetical protein
MNYVRKLGFEENPDYDFLRELFTKVLKTTGEQDDGVYDWMLLNNGKGWEASHVCLVLCSCLGKLTHYNLRRHHRYSHKLMLMLVHHKLHNGNTGSVSTGVVRDRGCKTSLPRTQLTLRFRPADQQLVIVHVDLVVMPVDNLSHRRVEEQANSSSRPPRYVRVSPLTACIPTRLRLLRLRSVRGRTLSQEPTRFIPTAYLPLLVRQAHSASPAMGMECRAPTHSCTAVQLNGLKRPRLRRHAKAARMAWRCMIAGKRHALMLITMMITVAVAAGFSVSYVVVDR